MSMQTNVDSAAGAPLWACVIRKRNINMQIEQIFEDNNADNFITGVTIGLFNYADGSSRSCTCRLEFKNNWFWR